MNVDGSKIQGLKAYITSNKKDFEAMLLEEAVHVRDKIEEIKLIGNINLLDNAYNLSLNVIDDEVSEVIALAEREGIAWAGNNLTLAFKLEWIQAIRVTLWQFICEFDMEQNFLQTKKDIYSFQKKINKLVDEFFRSFFLSYSSYKDQLLAAKNQLVESLSAPIIPIKPSVCILPLIGSIDETRGKIIEEKVLMDISSKGVQTLIMDLSGLAKMDSDAIQQFNKLVEGVTMMGCRAIVTGIRPEIVSHFVQNDISYGNKIETKATLQQALSDYLYV